MADRTNAKMYENGCFYTFHISYFKMLYRLEIKLHKLHKLHTLLESLRNFDVGYCDLSYTILHQTPKIKIPVKITGLTKCVGCYALHNEKESKMVKKV